VIIVSDTNILSSLAAANALERLQRLFARSTLSIPPAVRDELLVAVERGRTYLEPLNAAITGGEIPVLDLTKEEQAFATTLPRKLNAGEREAIALCQQRHLPLLCNDRPPCGIARPTGSTWLICQQCCVSSGRDS
jgi:predicted nucleic acid-binding protein